SRIWTGKLSGIRRRGTVPRRSPRADGVDESRRPGEESFGTLDRSGEHRRLSGGSSRAPFATDFRPAVSPRSDAYAIWRRDPVKFRAYGLLMPRRLEDELVHRAAGEPFACTRRAQPRDLRTLGRRRFVGRRSAPLAGDRRTAFVYLRRQRSLAIR